MQRGSLVMSVLSLVVGSSPAFGQPAPSLSDAVGRLKPGAVIAIETGEGPVVRGRFEQATAGDLVVDHAGSSSRIQLDSVTAVRVQRFDSLLNGAIIGFGIGALAGLWPDYYDDCEECHDSLYISMALGSGIGIGVDALRRGWAPVYRRQSARARVVVRPTIGRDKTAVHFVLVGR